MKHGLAGLVEEQTGGTGFNDNYVENIHEWVDALSEPVREAAVIACGISYATEDIPSHGRSAATSTTAPSMKGITGHGDRVLTSMFPGLMVSHHGKAEMECLTSVKIAGLATQSIE